MNISVNVVFVERTIRALREVNKLTHVNNIIYITYIQYKSIATAKMSLCYWHHYNETRSLNLHMTFSLDTNVALQIINRIVRGESVEQNV